MSVVQRGEHAPLPFTPSGVEPVNYLLEVAHGLSKSVLHGNASCQENLKDLEFF